MKSAKLFYLCVWVGSRLLWAITGAQEHLSSMISSTGLKDST
jgi:hypothetical protein